MDVPISFSEAKAQLLKGVPLSWTKFENHKAGSITLETAGARRLFKFLTEQASSKVAEANEQLFPGLIAAWTATDDPAEALATVSAVAAGGVWRLARIEAQNFGGLTSFAGPSFDMIIGRENWCLEGPKWMWQDFAEQRYPLGNDGKACSRAGRIGR
jgi:hypothetical protein